MSLCEALLAAPYCLCLLLPPTETNIGLHSGGHVPHPVLSYHLVPPFAQDLSRSPFLQVQANHIVTPELSQISALPPHPVRTVLPLPTPTARGVGACWAPVLFLSRMQGARCRDHELFHLSLQCPPPLPPAAQPCPRTWCLEVFNSCWLNSMI